MAAGVLTRVRWAAGVAVIAATGCFGLVAATDIADAVDPPQQLLPDLRVLKPDQILIERKGKRRIELKFSHTTANLGQGPLEISPDVSDTECAGNELGHAAHQYIYRQGGGPPEDQPIDGCMIFHPIHNHYHFRDFALYRLFAERSGKLVATSDKVSFCVFDLEQVGAPGLPGMPAEAVYGFTNCDVKDGTHGISVGWADIYSAGTPGQELDITGLPRGRYCLAASADPEDRITETAPNGEENNVRRVRLLVKPHKRIIRRTGTPCRTQVPA